MDRYTEGDKGMKKDPDLEFSARTSARETRKTLKAFYLCFLCGLFFLGMVALMLLTR